MKRFTFSVPQNILLGEGVLKELPGQPGSLEENMALSFPALH